MIEQQPIWLEKATCPPLENTNRHLWLELEIGQMRSGLQITTLESAEALTCGNTLGTRLATFPASPIDVPIMREPPWES